VTQPSPWPTSIKAVVKILVEQWNVNPNITDRYGATPLFHAVLDRHKAAVKGGWNHWMSTLILQINQIHHTLELPMLGLQEW